MSFSRASSSPENFSVNLFDKLLGLADKVSLLLTRKNPYHRGLSDQEAAQLVGMPIALQFSNDYAGVPGAILDGAPVSQRSSVGHSIMTLARSITPEASQAQSEPVRPRKFLEFFHVPSARDHETVYRD